MKGHFYKPHCKCTTKKCKCSATWSYMIDVGINPDTGKRKQKKKGGFSTKAEAEVHAAQLLIELKQGTYMEEQNVTFKSFVQDIWIPMYEKSGIKKSTMRAREFDIQRLSKHLQHYKMKDITLKIYQKCIDELSKELAPNSLSNTNATGKMIFRKAISMGVIKKNPTEFVQFPKRAETVEDLESTEEVVKYLEKEQLNEFLSLAQTHGLERDYPIFFTLAYTGMRVGELCSLKWKDIDFDSREISITKTMYNPNSKTINYELLTPKTKTSRRKITVVPELLEVLQQHKNIQNEVKMRYRNIYYDNDFVFAKHQKTKGYPETIKTINYRMGRLLKIAGLDPSLTPHSLRHTHTSLLAEAGASIYEIMDQLGHKNDKTTETVYLHVTKSRKLDISSKFSTLMKTIK